MKLVDIQKRNDDELAAIKRKVIATVKNAGCNTGEIRWSNTGAMFHVEVDNDGELGDYIRDIIRKSAYARLQSVDEYKGIYDWSSDTYVRPVTVVSFAF